MDVIGSEEPLPIMILDGVEEKVGELWDKIPESAAMIAVAPESK